MSVRAFFRDKSLLITGATGSLGKILVYKILKSCDVKTIYILLRGKRGKSFEERFNSYLDQEIFSYLPDKAVLAKIVPLEGDVTLPLLGFSQSDLNLCRENVNIIYHSAATINFSSHLRIATKVNVYGTQQVLELSRSCKALQLLLYVSSNSAFYPNDYLDEAVSCFPPIPSLDPVEFITRVENATDAELEEMSKEFIGHKAPFFPNTYGVTKTLAEILLSQCKGNVKVVIARPPLLFSAFKDPAPGWSDTVQTVSAAFNAFAGGIIQVLVMDKQAKSDQLPVDLCVNALLSITWHSVQNSSSRELDVVNLCVCNERNTISAENYLKIAADFGTRFPSIKQLRSPADPSKALTRSVFRFKLEWFIFHTLYAILVDCLLTVFGQKAQLSKLYTKLKPYFGEISFKVYKYDMPAKTVKITELYHKNGPLSREDRELFKYNPDQVDWKQLLFAHYMRYRRTVLKEGDDNIPDALKRMKRINSFANYMRAGFFGLVGFALYSL